MLDLKVGGWDPIRNGLEAISEEVHYGVMTQQRQPVRCSLEAYSFVYQQCTDKPARCESMLARFKQLLLGHLKRNLRFSDDCNLIREFNTLWKSYQTYANLLSRRVFSYLDRYFLQGREQDSLMDVAIALFNQQILGTTDKKRMFIEYALQCMGEMRTNLCITNNFMYAFTKSLLTINPGLFGELYSIFFVETEAFYKQKFSHCKYLTPVLYYARMSNLVLFEEAMVRQCFAAPAQTAMKGQVILPLLFAKHLIFPYTDIFLEHPNGLQWALRNNNMHLLNLVVSIYSKFEGFDKIKQKYYDYLLSQGAVMVKEVQNSTNQVQIIHTVAIFLDRHLKVLTDGFHKHQELYATETNAMEAVLSKWEKVNEVLLNFCKKSVNSQTFSQQQVPFKAVFEKLSHKDEFLHRCEQWVEQCILNKPQELAKLQVFVQFMHEIQGGQGTMKLEKLLKDYHEHNQQVQLPGLINCTVVGLHLWERTFKNQTTIRPVLPPDLDILWQNFEQSYLNDNTKKRLLPLPLSTKLILNLRLNSKTVSLKCNLLQACVLYCLSANRLTLEELVQKLVVEKHVVLSILEQSRLFQLSQNYYSIDWNYQSEAPLDWSVQVESSRTFSKAIEQDRGVLMEAGIVRLVKRKKEASFEEIYDSLCERIKLFRPQPAAVKSTISKLVQRDFIQANEQGLYMYKE